MPAWALKSAGNNELPASMLTAFKFRLYPTAKQEARLCGMVEAGRRLWNDALAHRKMRWEEKRLSTSYSQQCWILTAERAADPILGELYSQAGQDVLKRLDKAFEAFFHHQAQYPNFKKFSESGSFTYPQAYNGSVRLDELRKRLFLSKVGNVRVIQHRPVSVDGKLKTCTVKREADGKWYAILTFETEEKTLRPIKTLITSPVGIDLGLKSLIATSDGEKVEHPKFLRRAEKRLSRFQRRLSSTRKGSKNRARARHQLAVQHSKVASQRRDFNQKLSAKLVCEHDLVAFEDLEVRNMVRNHTLAKSISDSAWGQLRKFTEYKEARNGGLTVKVPPAYSTQECDFCGTLDKISLRVSSFECQGCHRILDRDFNAARIVLKRGLVLIQVGRDTPELKPVETRPLLPQTTEAASPVKEAGTIRDGRHASHTNARRWKPTNSFVGGCHISN